MNGRLYRSLTDSRSIVLNNADKAIGVLVWDRVDYIGET